MKEIKIDRIINSKIYISKIDLKIKIKMENKTNNEN
jgi:hypothetical protein